MTTHHDAGRPREAAMRRLAGFAALALAAALGTGACSEAITDPSTPVAIAFDSLPAPSIVELDSLRDPETGVAVPLVAQAFNSKGDTIPNPPFTFFPRDTGNPLAVLDGNYLVALKQRRTTPVTLIASLNGLQLSRTIDIVPRPDALVRAATLVPSLTLVLPDDPSNVSQDSLRVRVMHDSLGADSVPVRSWIVRYEVIDPAEQLADSVRIAATAVGAASPLDTTDASGLASRVVRVFAKVGTASGTFDTVVVRVHATYKGAEISGSPMEFLLPLAR